MLYVSAQCFSRPSNEAGSGLAKWEFSSQACRGAQMAFWYDNKMNEHLQSCTFLISLGAPELHKLLSEKVNLAFKVSCTHKALAALYLVLLKGKHQFFFVYYSITPLSCKIKDKQTWESLWFRILHTFHFNAPSIFIVMYTMILGQLKQAPCDFNLCPL